MSRKEKKEKIKKTKLKKILIIVGIVIGIIITLVGGGYLYIRNKIYSDDNIPKGSNVDFKEVNGITNILLIGTDARSLDEPARSDSIMILTIDNNIKKIKLTSIMRDTFVDIPGHGENKINAALSIGGVPLLIDTINQNFSMNLDKYLMVNFWGFESIIDILGGIEVDIKDYEIDQLNKYIGEQHDAKEKSPKIVHPGVQLLDGQQALSYARIRKTGNGDYERTDRQRRVLSIIAEKFKDVSPLKYPSFMTEMLPHIKTNIEPFALLNYAYTASKFPSLDFEQLRLPLEDLSKSSPSYKSFGWVLLIDKEQNGKVLNDFIYKDIKPSSENYSIQEWKDKLNTEYYGHNFDSNSGGANQVNSPYEPMDEYNSYGSSTGTGSTGGSTGGSHTGTGNTGGSTGGSHNGTGSTGGSTGGNHNGTGNTGGSTGGNHNGTGNAGGSSGGNQNGTGNTGGSSGGSQNGTGNTGGSSGGSQNGSGSNEGSTGGSQNGTGNTGGSSGGNQNGSESTGGSTGGSQNGSGGSSNENNSGTSAKPSSGNSQNQEHLNAA
ncbi:LCP family protein [Clostridium thermobutyricum]|uniref:Regulatory protein MsrR n=1 Tax=Clostridium thermobutyricum DSM 4928 TaxID=1121339 RepID=A0A1V4SYK2_9CLOT|nr:LCP family protein [Clostridium thermobutyricum]OPX50132.1 regulatory protein MsrR [Clostridium thermobutyricum DSM 4928]